MSKQTDFIAAIAPIIQRIAPLHGVLCNSAVIAQACLESAYGTSNKAKHHNYFGLKYRPGRLTCNTGAFLDGSSEQRADGTRYDISDMWYHFKTMEDGVEGYFQFTDIANYANTRGVTDPLTYLTNIRADGYATSLDYVKNVMAVVEKYNLTQYDGVESPKKEQGKVSITIHPNTGFKGFNVSWRTGKPKYIVMHYVGADGSAANNVAFFNTANRNASADFFVDEKGVWQFNPSIEERYTWHCGGGRQTSQGGTFFGICKNANSIGIEMCCYKSNGNWQFKAQTVTNAVALVQYLMDKYGIKVNNVIRHFDVTGKHCMNVPGWIPPTGSEAKWKDFLRRVGGEIEEELTDGATSEGKYMFTVETVSIGVESPSALLMQKLLKAGGYKGKDRKVLTLDSCAGTNTIYALKSYQKKEGLTVDGICGAHTWSRLVGV